MIVQEEIMVPGLFQAYASSETNPNWKKQIERQQELYKREYDIRSEYERDYTRILHSLAYRRLKHKTQVFFNIDNDHICTRMEHVQHVESVSCTIAKYLGLNVDLTRAIAMGHDLGHAPFGHEGFEMNMDLMIFGTKETAYEWSIILNCFKTIRKIIEI